MPLLYKKFRKCAQLQTIFHYAILENHRCCNPREPLQGSSRRGGNGTVIKADPMNEARASVPFSAASFFPFSLPFFPFSCLRPNWRELAPCVYIRCSCNSMPLSPTMLEQCHWQRAMAYIENAASSSPVRELACTQDG